MASDDRPPPRAESSAFLLTALGTHAQHEFAARVAELGLTPPQTGLLRQIARGPGRSQQELARQLGTPPTRLVALVDALEDRGLVERRRNPDDRRLHALHLSPAGEALMGELGRIAREHDDVLLGELTSTERRRLHELLSRVADARGLTPGVHPGYRDLAATDPERAREPSAE